MPIYESNLFSISETGSTEFGIISFFDDGNLSTDKVFVSLASPGAYCSIEAFTGTVSEGIFELCRRVFFEVAAGAGGYFAEMSDDYPNDLALIFELGGTTYSEHKLFKFGSNRLTLVATISGAFADEDVTTIRKYLNRNVLLKEDFNPQGELGDCVKIIFNQDQHHDFVGKIAILRDLDVPIE
jgi:hypothetical protein